MAESRRKKGMTSLVFRMSSSYLSSVFTFIKASPSSQLKNFWLVVGEWRREEEERKIGSQEQGATGSLGVFWSASKGDKELSLWSWIESSPLFFRKKMHPSPWNLAKSVALLFSCHEVLKFWSMRCTCVTAWKRMWFWHEKLHRKTPWASCLGHVCLLKDCNSHLS